MKIKITEKVKEFDGEVTEKVVTPFGTSAHIPFSKQHTGKIVNVIVSNNAKYCWVLSKEELNEVTKICLNSLKDQEETKLTWHQINCVNNLSKKYFLLQDLSVTYDILKLKNKQLASKLKEVYPNI